MDSKTELFEHASIPKAVVSMSLPAILSMIVVIIYNMADTFFIGQTGNSLMVSAISLSSPIFLIFLAFSSMFGIGGSSIISRALGMGERDRVRRVSAFCCYGALITGLIMGAVILIGIEPLIALVGANDATYVFTKEYLTWIGISGPFIVFSGAFGSIIRSEGAAKDAMFGNIAGSVTNIILDPILILALDMGVSGAAIATMIGNIVACLVYASYFFRKQTFLSIRPSDFKPSFKLAWDVASIGLPSTCNAILATAANILLNRILVSYSDAAVAGMGVAQKINTVACYILLGLGAGIQPLIGYNYGAGNQKRLAGVFKFSSICAVVIGSIITAAMVILRTPLIQAFIDDAEVIAYGTQILVALQMSGPILGLMFIGSNTIQAMGKVLAAFILNILRQGLFFIPMLYLLNHFFGMDGAIYVTPLADYLAVIASYITCIAYMKQMSRADTLKTKS